MDYNNLNQKIDADACITDKKAIAVGIKTADCLPILMYDEMKSIVAAVHSGWKGTVKRIVSKTVFFMIKKLNSNPSNIKVFIGPSICGRCYYVRSDVFEILVKEFGSELDFVKQKDFYFIDLKRINIKMLLNLGIKAENIYTFDDCTSCRNDIYQSFRKAKNTNMFQISFGVMI